MLISIHGTDKGNALLTALVLIMVLSIVFMSLAQRIVAIKRFAGGYKDDVVHNIEKSNREILNSNDLY